MRRVAAEKLVKAAKGADKALITEVKLFDIFQGGSLPEGKKSVALSVVLQPREKTPDRRRDRSRVGEAFVAAVEQGHGWGVAGSKDRLIRRPRAKPGDDDKDFRPIDDILLPEFCGGISPANTSRCW